MKKLQSLRAHLVESVPGIKANPERLLTFVQDGNIEHHRGPSLSHQYQTPIRIVLTDFSAEIDVVMIPLLQWLSHYEPDLDPKEAVRFEAELLSNNAWDLAIDVTIRERVVAVVNCDSGRIDVDHRMPEFPIDACPATHWQVYLRDENAEFQLISEWGEAEPTAETETTTEGTV